MGESGAPLNCNACRIGSNQDLVALRFVATSLLLKKATALHVVVPSEAEHPVGGQERFKSVSKLKIDEVPVAEKAEEDDRVDTRVVSQGAKGRPTP